MKEEDEGKERKYEDGEWAEIREKERGSGMSERERRTTKEMTQGRGWVMMAGH